LEFFSDSIPLAQSQNDQGQYVSSRVVPFVTIKDFYAEYVYFCECASPPIYEHQRAKLTTFTEAFNDLLKQKLVKLRGGKSGFPTCGVCNNLLGLRKSACCKRDAVTRDVILKLARLHLLQQKTERQHAENFIGESKKIEHGQPISAYIDMDPQSTWAGNTPKFASKKDKQVQQSNFIENRNIGVRIVCGPIDEYISISTNNLIPHGANVIVECVKYSMEYLARRLGEFGMVLPKKIGLQFDNSGENKVFNYI